MPDLEGIDAQVYLQKRISTLLGHGTRVSWYIPAKYSRIRRRMVQIQKGMGWVCGYFVYFSDKGYIWGYRIAGDDNREHLFHHAWIHEPEFFCNPSSRIFE